MVESKSGPSELWQLQVLFSQCFRKLLQRIEEDGRCITIGHLASCSSCTGRHQNSLHKKHLAADILIFLPDGTCKNTPRDCSPYGDFWRSLDPLCCWGGDFGKPGHYSITYRGMK